MRTLFKGHLQLRWAISLCISNGCSGSIWKKSAKVIGKCPFYDQPFFMLPLTKILYPSCRWPLTHGSCSRFLPTEPQTDCQLTKWTWQPKVLSNSFYVPLFTTDLGKLAVPLSGVFLLRLTAIDCGMYFRWAKNVPNLLLMGDLRNTITCQLTFPCLYSKRF